MKRAMRNPCQIKLRFGALRTTRPTMVGRLILKPPPLPEIGFAVGCSLGRADLRAGLVV